TGGTGVSSLAGSRASAMAGCSGRSVTEAGRCSTGARLSRELVHDGDVHLDAVLAGHGNELVAQQSLQVPLDGALRFNTCVELLDERVPAFAIFGQANLQLAPGFEEERKEGVAPLVDESALVKVPDIVSKHHFAHEIQNFSLHTLEFLDKPAQQLLQFVPIRRRDGPPFMFLIGRVNNLGDLSLGQGVALDARCSLDLSDKVQPVELFRYRRREGDPVGQLAVGFDMNQELQELQITGADGSEDGWKEIG